MHFLYLQNTICLVRPVRGLARRRPGQAGREQSLETPDAQAASGGRRRTPGVRCLGVEQPTEGKKPPWGRVPSGPTGSGGARVRKSMQRGGRGPHFKLPKLRLLIAPLPGVDRQGTATRIAQPARSKVIMAPPPLYRSGMADSEGQSRLQRLSGRGGLSYVAASTFPGQPPCRRQPSR